MNQLISLLVILSYLASPTMARAADDMSENKDKNSSKSEISDILDSVGYPELQVVPKASERLALEAKMEDSSFVFTHWPVEISGLATLVVGLSSRGAKRSDLTDKEARDAGTIASATATVGAAWIVGGVVLGAQRPYKHGSTSIAKYAGKDERSSLLRERLAEESLERPAKTMRVLQNIAVVTNLSMNVLSGVYVKDNAKVTAGVGALLAFLPWMFEDHNIEVYDKHIEYKKKIYAPLKSASFHYDAFSKTLTPMSNLVWTF